MGEGHIRHLVIFRMPNVRVRFPSNRHVSYNFTLIVILYKRFNEITIISHIININI